MNISLGILSWKAHKTLENTLSSFKPLLPFIKDTKIYFQEMNQQDMNIANQYGINAIGSSINTGIIGGFKSLVENASGEYFIFAENDFELVHGIEETIKILEDSINLLVSFDVDVVKLRDRINYGEPLYTKLTEHPDMGFSYKLESLHSFENPEEVFPGVFEIIYLSFKWYKCSNVHQKWSNNIFIARTRWLKEKLNLLEDGDFMMEETLIAKLKGYNLAGGIGLFKHNRLDR